MLNKDQRNAEDSKQNPWVGNENFNITPDGKSVNITWGKPNEE